MLLKDFFAKKIKCSEGRREEKVCDGVVADKVGTGAPGNEKCFKADQSLESLQRCVYVSPFQENRTIPVHTVQVFLPGICGDSCSRNT